MASRLPHSKDIIPIVIFKFSYNILFAYRAAAAFKLICNTLYTTLHESNTMIFTYVFVIHCIASTLYLSNQVVKDSCMPEYDEKFEWVIPLAELHSVHVEVTVATHKGWLGGSPVIGQVSFNLKPFKSDVIFLSPLDLI